MAGFGSFQFASPSQFGDWAQYAGLNRNTGEMEGFQSQQQGVKPPESLGQLVSQRISPVQNKMAAVAPAMQQAMQGNFVQAVGTMRSAQQTQTPQTPAVELPGYDYTHGLD